MDGGDIVGSLAAECGGEIRETHGSWVVVCATRAWKVKKPVRWSFLDYTTLTARLAACREEVRVNAALAPGIYLGVRPVLEVGGSALLGPVGSEADAIEYVVEMRRFDEHATMAARVAAGHLTRDDVVAAIRRIAAFHAGAEPCAVADPIGALRDRLAADLEDLDGLDVPGGTAAPRRFADGFLRREAVNIVARAKAGLIRDGHGDLRADHVVLGDPPAIVDRLEFDAALRCTDVADDLAFLAMDLESRGARWAADEIAPAYAAAGGTPAPRQLAAGFAWHRAIVRAKVALIASDRSRAAELLALADRLAWRARSSAVIVVCGPPASGKSTLARDLSDRFETTVISSDRVRKGLLGLAPADRAATDAYTPKVSRRVYAELARQARVARERDGGAIVDATFGRREDRARFAAGLGGAVLWIWCDPPQDVLARRAAARMSDPGRESDADPAVAATLARAFEPLDELEPSSVLRLGEPTSVAATLEVIARWRDENG